MLIDQSHKPWAIASIAILAVSVLAYIPYAMGATPPSGGSVPGLIYGSIGFGFMAFVTLLALRKKFPIWRIGRTKTWMRGHLWLGALSLPLILLHAGFLFGHGLTSVMMWLFVFVYASGVFGAWLQHTMPRRLLREVPMETIYDQIGHVREQLLDEADGVVADACGKLQVEVSVPVVASSEGANALATVMRTGSGGADDTAPLREFYMKEMRPFVKSPSPSHALANAMTAAALFGKVRPLVPAVLEPAIADLESICEEERQLLRQERMHGLLHAWLIVHVPLSFALMLLAVAHIFMALRF
ncbi:MAG TPA: hypothetical protein VEL51_10105 [Vicinamibacterales bacterium]|nr:hypothetical protein [Vicinamibacterales bacterium]